MEGGIGAVERMGVSDLEAASGAAGTALPPM